MKICFLASGDSIHSYRWVKYFVDRGHEVYWISSTRLTRGNIKGVSYYEIKISFAKTFCMIGAALKAKKLIAKIKPDILHVHYAGICGLAGALSGFHPLITTAWGSDVLINAKSMVKGHFVKFILNKTDLITCDAEHMREAMVKLGIDPKKISIIYFGTDTRKFRPEEKGKNIKNKLGIFDLPMIISLRSLEPVYDVRSLINAVPLVLKEVPGAKFVIAGTGTREKRLKDLAKSLGVLDSVKFTGFISNDELPQYLTSADIYVSTSLSDAGIAASTAEAMACGLPVVITDSGENKRWLRDGEGGFLTPVKNPELLAKKIIYLLKNKNVRTQFGKINRRIIEEKNNYYKEMGKMETIYKKMAQVND